MSLVTGKRLARHQWTLLPMTEAAINRVEQIAEQDNQPWLQSTGMLVEWRPDLPFDEDEDDEDYVYATDDADTDFNLADDDWERVTPHEIEDLAQERLLQNTEEDQDILSNDPDPAEDDLIELHEDDEYGYEANVERDNKEDEEYVSADENQPATINPYNLRSNRTRDYSHRMDRIMDHPANSKSYEHKEQLLQHSTERVVTGFVLTQMSAAAGIRIFGQPAEDAMVKEFCQLHEKGVFDPMHATALSQEQKKGALRAINIIKEKRSGEIKGRTCADGSMQRDQYEKSETSSPTVSSEALMYSLMIDAKERRDVATADVVGAYLNAYMDDFTLMKLTCQAVDIMVKVDKSYEKYVTTEGSKKVLYLKLVKALYGCVKSALLWYEMFTGTLLEMGFTLNPYDSCVANKVIDGFQCTVVWYVDDTKISHVNPLVVSKIIEQIESKFGKMSVTRGDKHTFLGMLFKLNRENGTVTISMKSYLEEAMSESKLNITRAVATPAQKALFDVNDSSEKLDKEEAEVFHSIVAKLLYVSIRARPDLLLAVSFLTTRVSKSTKQDQRKLIRVLQYIKGTLDLTLTIGADNLNKIRTWVDASYAVHPDMRSHTGGLMSMGTGAVVCKSSKQKLNTKSSTEAELVGATDYISNTIWSRLFLEAQGHKINENILEQDNISAIRLETNGRASAGRASRHIDIRYFFLKDRIKTEILLVKHCPTDQMLADFLTKPLQGHLFKTFRDIILGYQHTTTLAHTHTNVHEERVEKYEQINGEKYEQVDSENTNEKNRVHYECSGEEEQSQTENDDDSWVEVTKKVKRSRRTSSEKYSEVDRNTKSNVANRKKIMIKKAHVKSSL